MTKLVFTIPVGKSKVGMPDNKVEKKWCIQKDRKLIKKKFFKTPPQASEAKTENKMWKSRL